MASTKKKSSSTATAVFNAGKGNTSSIRTGIANSTTSLKNSIESSLTPKESLTMDNATYARSATGTANLIANFQDDCKRLRTALTGGARESLIKVFNSYWVGKDEENFVADFTARTNEIADKINTIQSIVTEALESDLKNFDANQESFYQR